MRILFSIVIAALSLQLYAQEDLNKTDANGLKQGKWEKKFENGQIRYTGQFIDDKPVGAFFYYYENGGKSSEVTYENESDVSHARFFHKNATIMAEGDYYKRQKHGEWKYYDNQTALSLIEHYENGVLQGNRVIYFLNGQVSAIEPYENGVKNGAFKEYFPNGMVKLEGTYLDGNFDGDYVQYFDDGTVYIEGQYKAAVKDGQWYYYDGEGGIAVQELWKTGELQKRVFAEGYKPIEKPVDIPEGDILDKDELMEQYFNEMNGGGNGGQ